MYDTLTNDANAFIDAKDQTAATAASQKLYADAKTAEESYPTPPDYTENDNWGGALIQYEGVEDCWTMSMEGEQGAFVTAMNDARGGNSDLYDVWHDPASHPI